MKAETAWNLARQTLRELASSIPGGAFAEINGLPFVVYELEPAEAAELAGKFDRFETLQYDVEECGEGRRRVQVYPAGLRPSTGRTR